MRHQELCLSPQLKNQWARLAQCIEDQATYLCWVILAECEFIHFATRIVRKNKSLRYDTAVLQNLDAVLMVDGLVEAFSVTILNPDAQSLHAHSLDITRGVLPDLNVERIARCILGLEPNFCRSGCETIDPRLLPDPTNTWNVRHVLSNPDDAE